MPTLNELKYSALVAKTGRTTGTLNELEWFALAADAGVFDKTLNELWALALKDRGYTGTITGMQMEYWGDLGYTGSWNERARQFYENMEGGDSFVGLHSEHTQQIIVLYVSENIGSMTGTGFTATVDGAPWPITYAGHNNNRISFTMDNVPLGQEMLISYSGGDCVSTDATPLEAFTDMISIWGIGAFAFAAAGSYYEFSNGVTRDFVLQDVAAGVGPATYQTTDDLYLPDFEGIQRQVGAGNAPWYGARYDNGVAYADDASGQPIFPVPKLYCAPEAENLCVQSNNFTDPAWIILNGLVVTQDQVGPTGEPNTAALLVDNNASAGGYIYQTRAGETATQGNVVWVMKDNDETRFPFLDATGNGGMFFNTKTGDSIARVGQAPLAFEVVDKGEWWKVICISTTAMLPIRVFAAASDVWDGNFNPTTGSCIIANMEKHDTANPAEIGGLGPIFTGAAAVTVPEQLAAYPECGGNIRTAAWFVEMQLHGDDSGSSTICPSASGRAFAPDLRNDPGTINVHIYNPDGNGVVQFAGSYPRGSVARVGVVFEEGAAGSANKDGVWGVEHPDTNGWYRWDVGTYLGMRFGRTNNILKYANVRRYEIADYAMGKELIDILMGQPTTITVGNVTVVYGYSISPVFGSIVSGGTFNGFTITHLQADTSTGIIRLNFNGQQVPDVDQITIKTGGTVYKLPWSPGDSDYRAQDDLVLNFISDNNGQDIDITLHGPPPELESFSVVVAPDGDDSNPGTEAEPIETLTEAKARVRAQKDSVGMGLGIEVILRGGSYQQTASLALDTNDSGEADNPVVWKSYTGETARVTGSQQLDPAWFSVADAGDPAWARIPAAAQGNVMVCDLGAQGITDYGTLVSRGFGISDKVAALELFADDEPIELARWPKPGVNDPVYTETDDYFEVFPTATGGSADALDATGGYTVSGTHAGENVWTKDEQIDGTTYYMYRWDNGTAYYWTISDTIGAYGTGRIWRGANGAAFAGPMNYSIGPEYGCVAPANPARIEGGFAPVETVPTPTTFTVIGQVAERMDGWTTETEAWVHGFFKYHYADTRLNVVDINTTTDTITLPSEPNQGIDDGAQFYIYNLLEELTQAGEYYLERSTGRLYYWPDGDIMTQDLQVSMLEDPAITLVGADYVTFDGLELSATRDQLITVDATCSNITIQNSKLLNAGNTAVHLDGADNKVLGNEIGNPGDAGVRINDGGDEPSITISGIVVDNNEIHHFGRWSYAYQPAVRINQGCGHQVTHNTMHHAPHVAIQVKGNEHVIEYNEIYSCVQQCSDMGAIYAYQTWALQGVSISYNYIHDMVSNFEGLGVHGIYLDGAASGATVYANYVVDVANRGIFVQSGLQQDVQGNILVRCMEAGYNSNEGGRSWINASTVDVWLDTLIVNNYQSDPWLSAYPQAATIPNDTVDILDDAQNWRVPKDSIFSSNLGWDNTVFLSVADPDYLNVYAEVANNVEDSDPLFVSPTDLNMQAGSPYWTIPGVPAANWFDDIGIQP